jgi:predicted transcriptional regulator
VLSFDSEYRIRYIGTTLSKDVTLHIKVDSTLADDLRSLAARRGKPVGELIRQAISAAYQTDLMDLPQSKRQAVEAYRGGFISIGKLAEVMGMHVLQLRHWLADHAIAENFSFEEGDSLRA